MVHLEATRNVLASRNHVDVVVGVTSLVVRVQNALSIKDLLTRDVQAVRLNRDQQTTVVLETHDCDHCIFQSSFRQVHIDSRLVSECTASSVRVCSRAHSHTVTTFVSAVESTVVHVSSNVLFRLTERQSQCSSTFLRHLLIQVVVHFFLGHDITHCVCNVCITSNEALDLRIILSASTLLFGRNQTEARQLNVFFVVHSRSVFIEQVDVLFWMLSIGLTPPSFNARPQGFGMGCGSNYTRHGNSP